MVFGLHPRMENLGVVGQGVRVFKDVENPFVHVPTWTTTSVSPKEGLGENAYQMWLSKWGEGTKNREEYRLNIIVNIPLIFINRINVTCIPIHTRQAGKYFLYITSVFIATLGHWYHYCFYLVQSFSTLIL